MNHEYVNQFGLVDEYLMGRLPAAESELFEEHFVDCPECVARLKMAGNFIHDLRRSVFYPRPPADPPKTLWPLLQVLWNPLALAACFVALLVAVCLFVGMKRMSRLRADVEQAKSASAQWETRYQEEQRTAALSEKTRQETEEKLGQIEAQLRQEQQQSANKPSSDERSSRPQINLPIFILHSLRGDEPINEIAVPQSGGFAIMLGLEGELNYEDYRVTVSDDRKRVVWKGAGFVPDNSNSLWTGVSSSFFRPGRYLLKLEGRTREKQWEVVGSYPFIITKRAR